MTDVFISYSRRDGGFVQQLAAHLEANGKSVWIDTQGIEDGEVFPEVIRHAIEQSDSFVFVISPDSIASRYCEIEAEYATELQKRVVPLLCVPVDDNSVPEPIRVRSWIPFTPDVDQGAASKRLLAALNTDLEHTHAHTRWLVKALDWETQGRDRSLLLRGSELASAEGWLAAIDDDVEPAATATQREFIYAGRLAAARRLRVLMVVSAAVALGSLILVVAALVSRNQAVDARSKATREAARSTSRAWAGQSLAQLPVDAERSILIAMAAVRKSPTTDALFALRRALDVSPLRVRLPPVGSQSNPYYWGPGISYSPDGLHVAEGSQDGSVRIFSAADGRLERSIQVGSPAPIAQFSPDGRRLAIASSKGVLLVDPTTGEIVMRTTRSAFYAGNLAFSPDGRTLYYTNYLTDRTFFVSNLYRWDLSTGRLRRLARGDIAGVGGGIGGGGFFFVQVTPDGRRLVVAGIPGVAVVDARSGRVIAATTRIPFVYWMTLSLDGRRIAVTESPPYPASARSGQILLLDARTLRRTATVGPRLYGDAYTALAFSPDGSRLAFGTNQGSAGVYDLRSGTQLVRFPGHTTNIYQLTFSPDGRRVATAAGDGRGFIWRAAGNQLASIPTDGVSATGGGFVGSDLADLGTRIVARYRAAHGPLSGRQVVRSWTAGGDAEGAAWVFGGGGDWYTRLSDSARFVITGPLPYGQVTRLTVLDTHDDRRVGHVRLPGRFGVACCPALSNDGAWIAYNTPTLEADTPRSELQMMDVASGRIEQLGASPCSWTYISFSRNDGMVAATDICGHVAVWNTASGRQVGRTLRFVGFINLGPVRFSPDGSELAVANSGNVGEVSLIDLDSGNTIAVLNAHTKGIQGLAFSPDGARLSTASLDSTVRVWDAQTGEQLRIHDDPAPVDSVAFSPDGRRIVSFDYAGVINVWDACSDCRDGAGLLALAGRRVTRDLTPGERHAYLR